ncbi:MAG: AMP-binding protein, partial [Anaerolineae bacterium]
MSFSDFYEMTLGQLLAVQAERFGERPYLIQEETTYTYVQANAQANRLAGGFQHLGLQSGDRLAVLLPNVAEHVLTIFAAAKAGLILVPINIRRSPEEIQARLGHTQAAGVVTFSDTDTYGRDHLALIRELQTELPDLAHVISIDGAAAGVHGWADLAG